jgi:hypothetical protein
MSQFTIYKSQITCLRRNATGRQTMPKLQTTNPKKPNKLKCIMPNDRCQMGLSVVKYFI